MKLAVLFFILFSHTLHSGMEDYFKKVLDKPAFQQKLRNIDFIYMINLDERPEKYQYSLEQLAPYGIFPTDFQRLTAGIFPWKQLTLSEFLMNPGCDVDFGELLIPLQMMEIPFTKL